MQLYCSKPALEINQFAVEAVRPGPVATFFPKPLFKTLKFQRRTKNLGKHFQLIKEKGRSAGEHTPLKKLFERFLTNFTIDATIILHY